MTQALATTLRKHQGNGQPGVQQAQTEVFERYESNIRTYCRSFPAVFARGEGSYLYDNQGGKWLDLLSGAGSLNYGHNHPELKNALVEYINANGVVNSLDLHTTAKEEFLNALNEVILQPRRLEFRCQFCGPTGTNVVEAALKLARKITQRKGVVAFSNSYHGMSAGSMAISSSLGRYSSEPYFHSERVTFLPFEGFTECGDELEFVRRLLTRKGSGIQPPAAFVLELVQCEGGINIPSAEWVRQIADLAKEVGALLIFDEIQTGCGRTGKFFCFEHYGVVPDLVCVSKSISGLGCPMSILLINPALDLWERGEHTGTFRGFTYSYVTGAKALRHFWTNASFLAGLESSASQLAHSLDSLKQEFSAHVSAVRQLGLLAGVQLPTREFAGQLQQNCFERGLIVEFVGSEHNVMKLLPPLTISAGELEEATCILRDALHATVRGTADAA
ncbi:MAG TPA: diaminobutyrate--2-oxoglutarate transaminase [Candidatus Angelobacter sp.]